MKKFLHLLSFLVSLATTVFAGNQKIDHELAHIQNSDHRKYCCDELGSDVHLFYKDSICTEAKVALKNILIKYHKNYRDLKFRKVVEDAMLMLVDDGVNEPLAKKLIEVIEGFNDEQVGKETHNLIIYHKNLKWHELYRSYYQNLVSVLKELPPVGKHPMYASSILKQAYLYRTYRGAFSELKYFLPAANINKEAFGDNSPEYAKALFELAFSYYTVGLYNQALPNFQRSLEIRKRFFGKESTEYANTLNCIAILYRHIGMYLESASLHQQVIEIKKKLFGEKNIRYAASLYNLSLVYINTGDYGSAKILNDKVLQIIKDEKVGLFGSGDSLSNHNSLTWLGGRLYYDNQLDHLLDSDHLEKETVLDVIKLLDNHVLSREQISDSAMWNSYDYYDNFIRVQGRGRYYSSKDLPFLIFGWTEKLKNFWHLDRNYLEKDELKAMNNMEKSRYDKALDGFEKMLGLRQQLSGKTLPDNVNSLYDLGLLYQMIGDPINASRLILEANNITLNTLSLTYKTLSENEKLSLITKQSYLLDLLPSFVLTQKDYRPDILKNIYETELSLKGMVFDDQHSVLSIMRKEKDSISSNLYKEWLITRNYLGKFTLSPANKSDYDSLLELTNHLEQDLSRRSAVFKTQQQSNTISLKDIGKHLLKDEVAIEFIRFRLFRKTMTDSIMYAAMIVGHQDSIPRFVPLFEEKQLFQLMGDSIDDKVIKKLYGCDNGSRKGSSVATNDSLYQLIWSPLERYLAGIQKIFYAPVGLLNRVSFQALKVNDSQFLIDKYQLNQVLNTRSVVQSNEIGSQPKSVSIWGDIEYDLSEADTSVAISKEIIIKDSSTSSSFNFYNADSRSSRGKSDAGSWGSLPASKVEVDSVKQIFSQANLSVNVLNGASASEETFKSLAGNSPKILHMATHGFSFPLIESKDGNSFTTQQDPLFRSGLVLAGGNYAWKGGPALLNREDGILTAYEIAQMDLSNTDLVVLSACKTALGALQGNEGTIGIQRALKMAGVKQMVVSLWDVYDRATMELMTKFIGSGLVVKLPGRP